jgi:PAS domain-containing protein
MDGGDLVLLAALLGASGGLAMLALFAMARIADGNRGMVRSVFADGQMPTVFLFDDEVLVDATPGARQLLGLTQRDGSAWTRLVQVLLPRFPTLTDDMATLVDRGTVAVTSADGRSRIEAEWRQGLARLTLIDVARQETRVPIDKMTLEAMEAELATLRGIAEEVPYLTWKESADGRIVWANAAYLAAADRLTPDAVVPAWPPRPLFPPAQAGTPGGRISISVPEGADRAWFDLAERSMKDGVLRVALPADAAVGAERSRAEFVQTLTKTFATLTVGLAIFDRKRRLALFNPALTDLTGLPAEFLIQRPSLAAFIDRLREARVLPEPKNFDSWRHRLSTLEAEAEKGTFAETWTLADGQVFEVSGRPHPDGAIAFLIQDVSAEMRLTRQFRDELNMNQAVLDSLEQSVAVFGADGVLMLANAAYCRMWDMDLRLALRQVTLAAAVRHWRTNCPTTPEWTRLSDLDQRRAPVREVSFQAERLTGQRLSCRFTPLPGGAMMASFSEEGEARSLGFQTLFRPEAKRI